MLGRVQRITAALLPDYRGALLMPSAQIRHPPPPARGPPAPTEGKRFYPEKVWKFFQIFKFRGLTMDRAVPLRRYYQRKEESVYEP